MGSVVEAAKQVKKSERFLKQERARVASLMSSHRATKSREAIVTKHTAGAEFGVILAQERLNRQLEAKYPDADVRAAAREMLLG